MRLRVRYAGRVQGVGFRATCRSIASRAPVTGWVRNEDDGTVLLEVQGEPAAARSVLDEIARVMQRHIIRADEVELADLSGEHAFEITR